MLSAATFCSLPKSNGSQPRICLSLLSECVSSASAVPLLRTHVLLSPKTAADLRMKASIFGVETSVWQQRYILTPENSSMPSSVSFLGFVLPVSHIHGFTSKTEIQTFVKFPEHSIRVLPQLFSLAEPFWFRKTKTDRHILAHIKIECLDERHLKLKIISQKWYQITTNTHQ